MSAGSNNVEPALVSPSGFSLPKLPMEHLRGERESDGVLGDFRLEYEHEIGYEYDFSNLALIPKIIT